LQQPKESNKHFKKWHRSSDFFFLFTLNPWWYSIKLLPLQTKFMRSKESI